MDADYEEEITGPSLISVRKHLEVLLYFFELSWMERESGRSIIRQKTCIENMQELPADPDDQEIKLVPVRITGEFAPFLRVIIYGKQRGKI